MGKRTRQRKGQREVIRDLGQLPYVEIVNKSGLLNMKERWLKEYMLDVYEMTTGMQKINMELLLLFLSVKKDGASKL